MTSAFRYCALIWNVADSTAQEHARLLLTRLPDALPGWAVNLDAPGFKVFSKIPTQGAFRAYALARQSGVVLGTIFPTKSAQTPDSIFSVAAADGIVASRGRSLINEYWGRYIAFVRGADPRTQWVLKDPTGRLPCFLATHAGVSLVFSYLPAVMALAAIPWSINWRYVASRVGCGGGRPGDTGIQAISEICGGECLEFHDGRPTRQLYWDPAERAADVIEDGTLASDLLRVRTKACVHAWGSMHETWLHRLSGGFDSSLVLACLAEAPSRPRVICVTHCWEKSSSSERPWARMAAHHSHVQHIELSRTGRLNFGALAGMSLLASPPAMTSFLEINQSERVLAEQYGATAISTGDGGDSLFGSSAALFSVSDFWKRHGLQWALLRHASDVALLRNQTVWSVLARSLRTARPRRPDHREVAGKREARQLVSSEIREPLLTDPDATTHPWFRSGRVSRGAREILAFLTGPEEFYDPISSPDDTVVESIFPLLSQPLVELCIRIPSYVHFAHGRDRGLARLAFAGDVPEPIVQRTWKDRVQGYPEEILRNHLPDFRSILLDGLLVKRRILDRQSVERSLRGDALGSSASVGEIIDHVLVESWLRAWSQQGANFA